MEGREKNARERLRRKLPVRIWNFTGLVDIKPRGGGLPPLLMYWY